MSTELAPDPVAEIERLERENAALDVQVKLLVRTEQRLCRARAEHERELARIRALGELSLAVTGAEEPAPILERAVELLRATFDVDTVLAVCVLRGADGNPSEQRVVATGVPAERAALSVDLVERIRGFASSARGTAYAGASLSLPACPQALAVLGAALLPEAETLLASVPLAAVGGRAAGVVMAARGARRASFHRETLSAEHEPFLALLGLHLERALESCALTRDLRVRGEQLAASLTHLERAQEELLQAQKLQAIGQLAGGVAHEFNNILTVILGHAELAQNRVSPERPEAADLQQVISAGRRAATVTQQLLAFGRKQRLRREPIDLNELASAMASMVGRSLGEGIELGLSLHVGLAPAFGDRGQLEQAVLNLVVNARDALPRGGRVRIQTRPAHAADVELCGEDFDPPDHVVLEVADDGIGMDAATRARIFEPFFTTKGLAKGSGLGLAMVYGYLKQSQGFVGVASEPGRGTTLALVLPSANKRPAAAATADGVSGQRPPSATILLVEDEDAIRRLASRLLESAGWRVVEAATGDAAVTAFERAGGRIDLLIADVAVPRMNGIDLAIELRRKLPALPVVLISGYASEQLDGLREGLAACRVLQKPFAGQVLVATVRELLATASRSPDAQPMAPS